MKTRYSWKSAIRTMRDALHRNRVQVLSCSFHDTVVFRKATSAEIEKKAADMISAVLGIDVREVQEARSRAVQLVTSRNFSLGFDKEACIEDVFLTWMRLLVGDRIENDALEGLAGSLVSYEVEIEASSVTPNLGLLEAVRQAHDAGVTTFVVADGMLGKVHISKILERHGLSAVFDHVVASADFKLSKQTGRLFSAVTSIHGGEPAVTLHVGDDQTADSLAPAKEGIGTILVYDIAQMRKRHALFLRGIGRETRFWIAQRLFLKSPPIQAIKRRIIKE